MTVDDLLQICPLLAFHYPFVFIGHTERQWETEMDHLLS